MKEQKVQYSEPTYTQQESTPASVSPAPMVERAFRLLDLLSEAAPGSQSAQFCPARHARPPDGRSDRSPGIRELASGTTRSLLARSSLAALHRAFDRGTTTVLVAGR